jgi:anti-sigma B factor antagonist
MEMTSRRVDGILVVSVSGRIDHPNAEVLKNGLAPSLDDCQKDGCPLVLDLAGVDYMSSVGLRVLMLAAKQMKAQGLRIVVAGLQPVVQEIFEISRFDRVFEVFPSAQEATMHLAATPR